VTLSIQFAVGNMGVTPAIAIRLWNWLEFAEIAVVYFIAKCSPLLGVVVIFHWYWTPALMWMGLSGRTVTG